MILLYLLEILADGLTPVSVLDCLCDWGGVFESLVGSKYSGVLCLGIFLDHNNPVRELRVHCTIGCWGSIFGEILTYGKWG